MKKFCFLSLLLFTAAFCYSQERFAAKEVFGAEANAIWPGAEHIWLKQQNTVPAFIQFRNGQQPAEEDFFFILKKAFQLPASYSFKLLATETDLIGWEHKRFQVLVNNVPVRNGIFLLHMQNGAVKKFNGYLFRNITVTTSASLSESMALNKAIHSIHANIYKWQLPEEENFLKQESGNPLATYFPKGELEILQIGNNESNNFRLAWKFDIYAHQPMSRHYVYVDAQTGTVLKKADRIHHANTTGTATTVYRGNRTITADSYNGQYRLREAPRGLGIRTYNMQTGTSYGNAVDFLDANNVWNNINTALDQYAGDAHWGAEMTYDFYTTMGRNSIDNAGYALNLYMHYDENYVNAFWDGTRMTFGDGNSNYEPLVSLDITGHEISHGLTERTSNLDYQDESGALNESFSDIFGAATEWYADSTLANWLLAEDIGTPFRSMSSPNTYGDPDTYNGTNWYTGTGDNGGVHTNSGVQNHWYYRLSVGGSGTNDLGNAYNVTAIGRNKAVQIAWRNDVNYLTSTSDYADARFYAIQSANDLFGVCSPEAISTTNAWHAVGVGAPFVAGADAQFVATPVTGCSVPFTVNFTNSSTNVSNFTWNFGDGGASTSLNPSHTYAAFGVYTVKLIGTGNCGVDSLIRTNYVNINAANACEVILPTTGTYQTQTACTGTIYDSGGPTGNYTDNTNSTVTIAPTGASQVQLHFTQFNMEANYDYLYVYDGPTTASPVIGSYTGTTIPADIVSTGSSITIRQYTDPGVVAAGFTIQWTCINPNSPPTANFKADVTQTCSGTVKFTDMSIGGPSSWLWTFGDGNTSTLQHPTHTYINNGTYTVSLKATNGFGNNTFTRTNYINVAKPAGPSVTNQQNCGPKSFSLLANDTDPVAWFDSLGNVVSNTNPFTTPVLNTTTTYFVQDTQVQPIYHVGPLSNAIGNGSNYNTTQTRALKFRVFKNSKLVSVLVYAQGDAYRTIQYRDSLGGVITNKTVFIPNGTSRVTLNIDLIPGGPYELGLRDTMNLYRNSTGAAYPYNDANGIVSIFGNNAPGSSTYYYFFYDWEVKEQDCISERVPVTATVNPAVLASATPTHVLCNGENTGAITLNVSSGTPGYTFNWGGGVTTQNRTNLAAGNYTVTVTDIKSCSATAAATVTQPTAISKSTAVTNVLCNGENTGAINLTVGGGTSGYTYNWAGGVTTEDRNNIAAGSYLVTITDANNCTTTASATVTQPTAILKFTAVTDVLCNGENTGAINLTVSGGTSGYTYNWGGGVTTEDRNNMAAGSYSVTITDANSCTSSTTATISQPTAITSSTTQTNVLCNGENTGAINLNVGGGISGYTYSWDGGATTKDISNLLAGNYFVTITDANNCTSTAAAIVSQPDSLEISVVVVNAACGQNNGEASLYVTGGTSGYRYLWSNSQTTSSILNLAPAGYDVTVTDANNCTVTTGVQVIATSDLTTTKSFSNVTCFGLSDGTASVTVTNGTPAYTYLWSNTETGSSIQNVTANQYTVTITDGNGCMRIDSFTVSEPAEIVSSISVTNALCFGDANGTVQVIATGGNGNFSYEWSNTQTANSISNIAAGIYSVTITDTQNCTASSSVVVSEPDSVSVTTGSTPTICFGESNGAANAVAAGGTGAFTYLWCNSDTTPSVSNLSAGNCTVTVTDVNGCSASATALVQQPQQLQPVTSSTNGTATVDTVYGAASPVNYVWSNGATTQTISGLASGTYLVTVTDANNCTAATSISVVSVGINQLNVGLGFRVYPNPVLDNVIVEVSAVAESSTLRITNVLGQEMLQQKISSLKTEFDLSRFATGVYYAELISHGGKRVQQIVVGR